MYSLLFKLYKNNMSIIILEMKIMYRAYEIDHKEKIVR